MIQYYDKNYTPKEFAKKIIHENILFTDTSWEDDLSKFEFNSLTKKEIKEIEKQFQLLQERIYEKFLKPHPNFGTKVPEKENDK